jgi:hypothetical protein
MESRRRAGSGKSEKMNDLKPLTQRHGDTEGHRETQW